MKALLVDLETAWRGGQNQALLILKGLRARGHEAELVAARGSALGERAAEGGVRVHSVSRGLFRVPAARKVRELVRGRRFDLVHANEAHAVSAVWLAGAHKHIPFLISRRVGYPIGKSWASRARYEASHARRQYAAVDPTNRLVAGELERRWNEALQVERGVEGGAFDREPVGHGNIRRGAHDALECAARVKQAPRRRSLWTRIFLRLRPLNAQAARRSDIDNVVTSLSQSPRLEVRRSRRCCLRKCAPR